MRRDADALAARRRATRPWRLLERDSLRAEAQAVVDHRLRRVEAGERGEVVVARQADVGGGDRRQRRRARRSSGQSRRRRLVSNETLTPAAFAVAMAAKPVRTPLGDRDRDAGEMEHPRRRDRVVGSCAALAGSPPSPGERS